MSIESNTWAQTHTGIEWKLHAPSAADVRLEDICISLSRTARFNGHTTSRFGYSVAQHSIYVQERVNDLLDGGEALDPRIDQITLQFAALLHDAHETYLGDLPLPLKRLMPPGVRSWWDELVEAHDNAIADWAGIDPALMWHPLVKRADAELCAAEKRDLMGPEPREWELPFPAPNTIGNIPAPNIGCRNPLYKYRRPEHRRIRAMEATEALREFRKSCLWYADYLGVTLQ